MYACAAWCQLGPYMLSSAVARVGTAELHLAALILSANMLRLVKSCSQLLSQLSQHAAPPESILQHHHLAFCQGHMLAGVRVQSWPDTVISMSLYSVKAMVYSCL